MTADSAIARRLDGVRERIGRAAAECGRSPGEIRLVAVSKTKSESAIRQAYAAGQRLFGENYAQELDVKANGLADLSDIEWHYIGHLQSNKAKVIARYAHVVHTVDSVSIARELGKRVLAAGRAPLPVLVEVNIGGEAQKHGVGPADVSELLSALAELPSLAVRGLMTVPPAGGPDIARRVFDTLATLRALHGGTAALPELSMGMSADLEVAIASGATLVRVGTAIFGER